MCGTLTGPYLHVYPPPIGPGALSPLGQVHRDTQTASPRHLGRFRPQRDCSCVTPSVSFHLDLSEWSRLARGGRPGSVESLSSGKKPFNAFWSRDYLSEHQPGYYWCEHQGDQPQDYVCHQCSLKLARTVDSVRERESVGASERERVSRERD